MIKIDVSAQPMARATWEDLDIVEFARLRRMVEEYRGDTTLLDLGNVELARALGLVASNGKGLTPTMAGLLLVGQESALRTYIPTHEVAFQVLRDSDVLVNEFYRWPLLRIAERIFQAFEIRNEESELNYELSSEAGVHIELYGGSANLNLVELIINEQKRQGHSLDVSTLLILNYIHREREIEISQVPDLIQRPKGQSVAILEELVETGLLERRGRGQRRTYYFSARSYRELGQPETYVRTLGFEPLQMEQMIVQYVAAHDRITRSQVMNLCRVGGNKASYLLKKLVKRGELQLNVVKLRSFGSTNC